MSTGPTPQENFTSQLQAQLALQNRPWYKKKRFLVPGAILILAILGNLIGGGKQKAVATNDSKNAKITTVAAKSEAVDPKTTLRNYISGIEKGDDMTKGDLNDVTSFQIVLAVFDVYAKEVESGKESDDPEIKALAFKLEQKASGSQKKNFPKLRRAYQKFVANKLWEHDIDVNIKGSNNTTLKLVAGYFAANKNIKTTQETLQTMLKALRFKRTEYQWYNGQDEYTYYTIDSPADGEVSRVVFE